MWDFPGPGVEPKFKVLSAPHSSFSFLFLLSDLGSLGPYFFSVELLGLAPNMKGCHSTQQANNPKWKCDMRQTTAPVHSFHMLAGNAQNPSS